MTRIKKSAMTFRVMALASIAGRPSAREHIPHGPHGFAEHRYDVPDENRKGDNGSARDQESVTERRCRCDRESDVEAHETECHDAEYDRTYQTEDWMQKFAACGVSWRTHRSHIYLTPFVV